MKYRLTFAIAAGLALFLLGAHGASADPMRCSAEQRACNANCVKYAGSSAGVCVANCRVSQANCVRTGCWDNGGTRFCGLMKQ